MTGLLASVRNLAEARLAQAGGAEIIDLKEPAAGALGAVSPGCIGAVRAALPNATLSATIGDLPMAPQDLLAGVRAIAADVDYVKVGFFPGGDRDGCVAALSRPARAGTAIVAVLFADQGAPAPAWLDTLAAAGLRGAMLDTAHKGAGLRRHLSMEAIAAFVADCRRLGLLCGLAGSLALDDIPPLLSLAPDYLGFRGALCAGDRRGHLHADALAAVRAAIPSAREFGSEISTQRRRGAEDAEGMPC